MNRAHIESISRQGARWYPASDGRIVATMLGDTKIVVDQRDFSVTPHIVMSGYWESWITSWAMRWISATDKLLNIGANCGYYTMLAARIGATVVAVEPQKHLAEGIRLSAALNGWTGRVTVEECVAGVEAREVTLQLYPDFHGSAHVQANVEEHPELAGGTTVVEERPASELMPDATCVFIDAEGYEPHIWKGLGPMLDKKQIRWVALEWAPVRYEDPRGFLKEMRSRGPLSVIRDDGSEIAISDERLVSGEDWDTLIVRPS